MSANHVLGSVGFLVFSFAQVAVAQVKVTVALVPDNPGPYSGGEIITVDVWLHSNLTEEHRLALVQFDFSLTDPDLSLAPAFTFDYSSIGSPNYYDEQPELPVPWTWNRLEGGFPDWFLPLPAGGVLHIGSVGVQVPTGHGVYRLDALNAAHTSPDVDQAGALIGSIFVNFPWKAFNGEVTDGFFDFVVPPPIPTMSETGLLIFAVLLACVGSWIAARRLRCGANERADGKDASRVHSVGVMPRSIAAPINTPLIVAVFMSLGISHGVLAQAPASICGPTDDRVPSFDPRSARALKEDGTAHCTAFLFNQRPNCLLTAGHCYGGIQLQTVEFNVPESSWNGTINHPPPQHQYRVDQRSVQILWIPGVGNDWCLFGVFNNDMTGRSPLQTQGASYRLAVSVPPADGSILRVTGYGVDDSSYYYNRIQQTHSGPYADKVGTLVKYVIDTKGGNSGSAVELVGGGLVYAIHNYEGCSATGGANQGTAIDHPGLRCALACPVVFNICTDCNDNGILDRCDVNCASTCPTECNVPGCNDPCGGSDDCNSNGVPDECEPDCNENGIPDDCDLPSNPVRACCLPDVYCELRTQWCCELEGGIFKPLCKECEDCNCPVMGPGQ